MCPLCWGQYVKLESENRYLPKRSKLPQGLELGLLVGTQGTVLWILVLRAKVYSVWHIQQMAGGRGTSTPPSPLPPPGSSPFLCLTSEDYPRSQHILIVECNSWAAEK